MDMNTEITNVIDAAGDKSAYDECAKKLLGQKNILAHILVKTVKEFEGMKPEQVVPLIEGEPYIGKVPIEPGMTNKAKKDQEGQRIVGLNTEESEINEGTIRFDILFYVRTKNGLSKIIVNIEVQKDEPTRYSILNRAIFYVSRQISSQKEREFVRSNFDDIKQVFNIWICMNMKSNILSHIHLTKDEMLEPYEWKGDIDLLNIVMIGITDTIPEHDEKYEMHRLVGALLSSRLKENEKLEIIENEYNIPVNEKFREDVKLMCNLSEGVEEKAMERGMAKGMIEMGEECGLSEEKLIFNLQTKLGITHEKAEAYFHKYSKMTLV